MRFPSIVLAVLAVPVVLSSCDPGSACGDCADAVPCTTDSCDAATGLCRHEPDHALCGAGFRCDLTQGCVQTVTCQVAADCDDSDPCTTDRCDPVQGCLHQAYAGACDDGDPCTLSDSCATGSCQGAARSCDDQNACTQDACQAEQGCVNTPTTAACDDGNACTEQDSCAGGVCSGAPRSCDDQEACTQDSCDTTLGCQHAPLATACDDGDPCTRDDFCQQGACQGTPLDCDDLNPCTDDLCAGGACQHPLNTEPCDDGNPCTAGEACQAGQCQGGVNSCQCTLDADCAPYENGNLCDGTLECRAQRCEVDPGSVVSCDTSQDPPCRRSVCQPANGSCALTDLADGANCDDGDACTSADACLDGQCAGQGFSCADGNPCTDDACDSGSGCVYTPNAAGCNDGNACTQGDHCAESECRGQAVDCADGNPCTDDRCLPASGCENPANNADCDDQDACTQGDRCAQGQCGPGEESCCTDTQDNDGDGVADCQDAGCSQDPACAVYQVDWCRLQWPLDLDELEGAQIDVYGRLYILGVTTRTPGTDADPKVRAELGHGPRDSDPTQAGWTWQAAAPNPAWLDAAEPGNDEYWTTWTAPPAAGSPYDFAFRFSADSGTSWTVCDRAAGAGQDGSEDGYQGANAGKLTSREDSGPAVGWCRLQWPAAVDQAEGSQVTAYGRVYIAGLTDQTHGTDVSAQVVAQVGYGPDGSQPDQGGWVWTLAGPNPGWDDAAEPNNDEYQAALLVPPASGSPYDLAYRFSANGGQTWLVCDTNAGPGSDGSADGYAPATAGSITARASAADASNWGFEESWAGMGAPPDFVTEGTLGAERVTDPVGRGLGACLAEWDTPGAAGLRMGKLVPAPAVGQVYSLHVWVRDQDSHTAVRPVLWLGSELAPGLAASQDGAAFVELIARAEIQGAPLPAFVTGGVVGEAVDTYLGTVGAHLDDFDLTLRQPFQADDGSLDSFADTLPAAPYEVTLAPEPLHVALNDQAVLYVAGAPGISGATDKMIFVWQGGAEQGAPAVPLPWNKTGTLAAPYTNGALYALVEEPSAAFCAWYRWDASQSAWLEITAGAICRGGAVLEGSLALVPSGDPSGLPTEVAVASVQVNTPDGGSMWSSHQTPACELCDDDALTADETLAVHRAAILVGRVR